MSVTEIAKKYKYVLFLDADIFIKNNSPDIFNLCGSGEVCSRNEMTIRTVSWKNKYDTIVNNHAESVGMEKVSFYREHYNGGMILFDSVFSDKLFSMPPWDVTGVKYLYKPYNQVKQQPWRNYCICRNKVVVKDIGYEWNCLPSKSEDITKAYFVHATGFPGWNNGEEGKIRYLKSLCLI
jgi:hypothetical protein